MDYKGRNWRLGDPSQSSGSSQVTIIFLFQLSPWGYDFSPSYVKLRYQTGTTYWCCSIFFFFLNKFIYLFIFGCLGSSLLGVRCCTGLSLVVASGGYSSLWCVGFSLQYLLLLQSSGSRHAGFSSCGTQAQ